MARIQILELPSEEGDDGKIRTPFALIVDQCDEAELTVEFGNDLAKFRNLCGARAGLATAGTLDIPGLTAEELATYGPKPHLGTAVVDVVPNLMGFADAIRKTVEAIGPQQVDVRIGDQAIRDIVKAELDEHDRRLGDAANSGRS